MGRGRPSLHPGEPSVPLSVSVEQSLYQRLLHLAEAHRVEMPTLVRRALREYSQKNLTPHPSPPTLHP